MFFQCRVESTHPSQNSLTRLVHNQNLRARQLPGVPETFRVEGLPALGLSAPLRRTAHPRNQHMGLTFELLRSEDAVNVELHGRFFCCRFLPSCLLSQLLFFRWLKSLQKSVKSARTNQQYAMQTSTTNVATTRIAPCISCLTQIRTGHALPFALLLQNQPIGGSSTHLLTTY